MSTQNEVNNLINILRRLEPDMKKSVQPILRDSASLLVAAIKGRAPVGTKPHKRYKRGNRRAKRGSGVVAAEYKPGNLRKSFTILPLRRVKSAVIVGASTGRGKIDGYYGKMVEGGHGKVGARPFVAPAVQAVGTVVTRSIIRGLEASISNFKRNNRFI